MADQLTITPTLPDYGSMNIADIAGQIQREWGGKANYAAKPYLDAMFSLNKITDAYYADTGASVVAYFLANATSFKGDAARAIKKELNKRLKEAYKR